MSAIRQNLEKIHIRIGKAEFAAGRAKGGARLVAVSKNQSMDAIDEAILCGQRLFGENRVQEAALHFGDLKKTRADIELHLIGPLQTNKIAEAVALFDCIETLDREKLAQMLGNEMKKQNRHIPCFIQVNTGEEPQKAGIAPKALSEFLLYCREDCGLEITGLMSIPPADEPAALHFALLRTLAERAGLPFLSMGMSADFEKAIALGATHIRIGTALFGQR